jgi:hypothetical protein
MYRNKQRQFNHLACPRFGDLVVIVYAVIITAIYNVGLSRSKHNSGDRYKGRRGRIRFNLRKSFDSSESEII